MKLVIWPSWSGYLSSTGLPSIGRARGRCWRTSAIPVRSSRTPTWLLLGKNRHGPLCEIPVEFDYRTLRVREALADEEGEWP